MLSKWIFDLHCVGVMTTEVFANLSLMFCFDFGSIYISTHNYSLLHERLIDELFNLIIYVI